MADETNRKDEVDHWIKELTAARKREQEFRTTGRRVLELYDGTKAEETPFNILYSNTETLFPALYSATPRPVVQRRFKDDDPMGKASAQAGQRMLEYLIDTDQDGYEKFDDGLATATLNALLPGRAVTIVKYDGEESSETVCLQSKKWNRVLHGYATRWEDVPWVAYEDYIDKPEAVRLFGEEKAALVTFSDQEDHAASDDTKGTKEEPHQGERKLARIWQIWDKDGGKVVRYVSEQYTDDYLKTEDDPLGLTGFFNCPKPLQLLNKPHSLIPTALYVLYESQAKELNELTRRIKKITHAIKARGLYDGELGGDIEKLMEADDNKLVPTDKGSSLSAEKGLQNAVWFWPLDVLIVVLRELYAAREACKQVIYEIMGISDILRGASKASETLGAQEIKAQWGGLRIKRAQKDVARYASDVLRMMLEIAATKFSEETWAQMTGLPFLLSTKWNELTALAQVLTQQVQQIQASQPPLPPGPQAGPPPIPPEVQQLQQIQAQLQAPKWSDVLALLRQDYQRAYRIDIETNSTVEPEAAEDHKMIAEVLTTMGQVLNGIGPLVAKGVLPFEAAQVMLLTIVRRFRFGSELEDTIKAMQPPKPEDDAAAAEAQQKAMELQAKQAEADIAFKQKQSEMAIKEMVMAEKAKLQQLQMKVDQQQFELDLAKKQFKQEQQAAQQALTLKAEMDAHKIELKQKSVQWQQQHRSQPAGAGR